MTDAAERPLSTMEYLGMLLLLGIPLVNVVLLLVWGLGSGGNVNRRNFCRAVLLIAVIAAALWVVSFATGLALFDRVPELRETLREVLLAA